VSVRTERVGANLREALSQQFQRNLPDYLDGMITVVSVKMSSDLSVARVYISIFRSTTDPEILIKRLNTHVPEIRHELARQVQMKFVPELRFFRDDTLDAVERIDELLREVRREDEERIRLRGDAPTGDDENNASQNNTSQQQQQHPSDDHGDDGNN
jgi:ribosome-binding factor A